MEGKFKKGKEVLVEKLELPKDVILDIPKIIVMGRNEITIENHKGIIEYSPNNIRIGIESGVLCIEGADLFLNVMDHDMVVISGRIHHIMKLDGGKR